jgi:hypothetical protein
MTLKNLSISCMLAVALILLGACSSSKTVSEKTPNKSSDDVVLGQDGPQDSAPEDIIPFSEATDEYSLWIETSDTPKRTSEIRGIIMFQDGKFASYGNIADEDKISLEEIKGMKDDEIVKVIKEVATAGSEGDYTLNIKLDEYGQNTKELEVVSKTRTSYGIFVLRHLVGENDFTNEDDYLASLREKEEKFEVNGENITIYNEQNEAGTEVILQGVGITQSIFDTKFSGLRSGDHHSLLTRVEDSFAGFKLDTPDSKNVTIEGN